MRLSFTLVLLLTSAVHAATRPCEGQSGVYRVNPDQTPGGFVATTAIVSATTLLGTETQVCDAAVLIGDVKILDRAIVGGRAQLKGDVVISGSAQVYGDANLWNDDGGELAVMDDAKVYGDALIHGSVMITGTSEVFGAARLYDFVQIHGASRVCARSILTEDLILTDDTTYCPARR